MKSVNDFLTYIPREHVTTILLGVTNLQTQVRTSHENPIQVLHDNVLNLASTPRHFIMGTFFTRLPLK